MDHRQPTLEKLSLPNGRPFFVQYCEKYDIRKPPKKKAFVVKDVTPNGDDTGQGSKRLLKSYANEVLIHKITAEGEKVPDDSKLSFEQSNFVEQSLHPFLQEVPLLSQTAYQKILQRHHSDEKKRQMIGIYNQLIRSDGCLVRLRLSSEDIDDPIIIYLSKAAEKNIYLQYLMLHNNFITDIGIESLCMALRWHPSIHTLWLGANLISDKGASHLATLLRRNAHIKDVNLSNKWPRETWTKSEEFLHPHVTSIGAEYLAKQLLNGSNLTSLSLADQRIHDDGAIALFSVLKASQLRVLNIASNRLTDNCCAVLKASLSSQPFLEKLVLSSNSITGSGCVHIAAGLAFNTILQALDLSRNLLDDKSLEYLSMAIERNQVLSSLSISDNPCNAALSDELERMVAREISPKRNRSLSNSATGSRPNTNQALQQIANQFSQDSRDDYGMTEPGLVNTQVSIATPSSTASANVGVRGRRPYSRPFRPSSQGDEVDNNTTGRDSQDTPTLPHGVGSSSLKNRLPTTSSQMTIGTINEDFEENFSNLFASSLSLLNNASSDAEFTSPFVERKQGELLHLATYHNRRTKDVGKILGVPDLGHMGVMPIRSAASRFRDSGQHSMYLRILTPNDPPGTEPVSVLKVVLDNEAERRRIIASRDNQRYRERKRDKLTWKPRDGLQRAALKPPPEKFWKTWASNIKRQYSDGIDHTSGCTSTRLNAATRKKSIAHVNYDVVFNAATGTFVTAASQEVPGELLKLKRSQQKKAASIEKS